MLIYHELLMLRDLIKCPNFRARLDYLAKSDVKCFVIGEARDLSNEQKQELADYFTRTNTSSYMPFPKIAVHVNYQENKYIRGCILVIFDQKDEIEGGSTAMVYIKNNENNVLSSLWSLLGPRFNDEEAYNKFEQRLIGQVQRHFEYSILFNRFTTEKPSFEGMSRQQRRSMGLKKISDVVHIYPERAKRKSYAVAHGGVKAEFTHRFDRSGHFRRIKGIGKDQTGTYGVQGMTWVRNHVVGPEDKPYVSKTRVVHTGFKENENVNGN